MRWSNVPDRGAQRQHPRAPVEPGGPLRQLGQGQGVVREVGVPVLDDVPVPGGELGLQGQHAAGELVGPGLVRRGTAEAEHAGDVRAVGGEHRRVLRVAVVGLVRQPQAALHEVHGVPGGLLRVVVDVEPDGAARPGALQGAQHPRELGLRGCRLHQREVGAQRCDARGLDGVGVHERRVHGADLRLDRVRGRPCRGGRAGVDDDVADVLLRLVVQGAERAVHRPVGGDHVGRDPAPVHVGVEVVLRADVRVECCQVDATARHAHSLRTRGTGTAVYTAAYAQG